MEEVIVQRPPPFLSIHPAFAFLPTNSTVDFADQIISRMLAVGSTDQLLYLYDVRQMNAALQSFPLPSPPIALSWDQWDQYNRAIVVNGGNALYWMDLVQAAHQVIEPIEIALCHNTKYPRPCLVYEDDVFIYGDDKGVLSIQSKVTETQSSISVSSCMDWICFYNNI